MATLFHLFPKAVLQVVHSALEIHCEWRECYTWQSKHWCKLRHNDVAKSITYLVHKHA